MRAVLFNNCQVNGDTQHNLLGRQLKIEGIIVSLLIVGKKRAVDLRFPVSSLKE